MMISENPKKGTTYLAVMPRARKPKAIPQSAVGFYQNKARLFYEAPGMTAAEAREAIKEGTLQPTWIKGQPVVGYASDTGAPRTERRTSLGQMLQMAEEHGVDAVLRIGTDVYTPQWSYRGARKIGWHEVSGGGFTYDPDPIGYAKLEQAVRNHETFEVGLLREDYNGIPLGGIAAMVKAGYTLEAINDPMMKRHSAMLSGRRYKAIKVIEGGMIRQADLESLMYLD
jgi:hypothetical protein